MHNNTKLFLPSPAFFCANSVFKLPLHFSPFTLPSVPQVRLTTYHHALSYCEGRHFRYIMVRVLRRQSSTCVRFPE